MLIDPRLGLQEVGRYIEDSIHDTRRVSERMDPNPSELVPVKGK